MRGPHQRLTFRWPCAIVARHGTQAGKDEQMEFGTFYEFPVRPGGSEAGAFSEGFELIDDAERMGLDAFWLSESHCAPGVSVLAAPMTIASAIAGRTRRMRVGLAVQVLPLGNPLRIAEDGATVDQISQGRLIFGVGRSGSERAYKAYGIPYEESRDRFTEALDIIRKAWTEPTLSYQGRWHTYSNVNVTPKPYQRPHPEIRIAANSPRSFERFGTEGFQIFLGLRQGGISQLVPHVQTYRKAYKAAGHPGAGGVYIRVPVYVADTDAQALSDTEWSITEYFRKRGTLSSRVLASVGRGMSSELSERPEGGTPITWDELLEERVIVGSVQSVTDRLRELRGVLGIDGILAEINSGGQIPAAGVKRSLQLLCEEVMPAFR
jgi:alkanesulfonate monooxygenase SsuD/methylene tetrahydromethanopterin reductase-like flavin-dependent oxidoreductase (luciferase family)